MPPSIRRSPHRSRQLVPALLLTLALGMAFASVAQAREGDSRAGLYVGTTTFGVDSQTTHGATFGITYGYEFVDNLLWTAGLGYAATEGTAVVDDGAGGTKATTVDARSTEYRAGLLAYVSGQSRGGFSVFAGGGISALSYELNFPGTTVGTTSGTAPGLYLLAGTELPLSRSVTFIPQFNVQVHSVKTESGSSTGLVSGGLVISLRISG